MKICTNCQTENDAGAKFCFHCGSELPAQASSQKICQECGFENADDAKFCASCGTPVVEKPAAGRTKPPQKPSKPVVTHQASKKKKNKKPLPGRRQFQKQSQTRINWNPKAAAIIAAGAILLVLYFVYMNQKAARLTDPYTEQRSTNAELESKVLAVASKFICACGSCPREPLESCSCPTAQRERDYIRNGLYSGMSEESVIVALNQKYGGLRSVFEDQYGAGNSGLALPSGLKQNSLGVSDLNTPEAAAPATFANRSEIISRFSCPCGQCAVDELSDCTCDHPNGAEEVKQFIDAKISQGGYTVAEVVDLVETQYGGRTR